MAFSAYRMSAWPRGGCLLLAGAICAAGVLPLTVSAQNAGATTGAAAAEQASPTEPEIATIVQVTGVETLVDYATVGRLLGAAEGVRRVDLTQASGLEVTFRVLVRGGDSALVQALESVTQLVRSPAASGGRLAYEFRR